MQIYKVMARLQQDSLKCQYVLMPKERDENTGHVLYVSHTLGKGTMRRTKAYSMQVGSQT